MESSSLDVSAAFTNPTATGEFEYAVAFRSTPEPDVSYDTQFRVSHDRRWGVIIHRAFGPSISQEYRTANWRPIVVVDEALTGPFDTTVEGSNRLRVILTPGEGCLYVNDALAGCTEMPELGIVSYAGVGSVRGDVWFSDLQVVSLSP